MVSRARLRPPSKWYGGKYYLAPHIIPLFPKHQTYLEPFGGGASVLLNKAPAPIEVYNDLDHRIVRVFRVLRDDPEEFQRRLALTPYSEAEFLAAKQPSDDIDCDDIELARRDLLSWRLSRSGAGESFSYTTQRVRRGMADVVSGFLSCIDDQLPLIVERIRRVQILCRPAAEVIVKWDSPNTLIYCDPPYLPETREKNSQNVYLHEMPIEAHVELAKVLNAVQGSVVLSGYPSELYCK